MERKRVDQAVASFKSGFSCSQSVLSAYAEHLRLNEHAALKVSGAFGGGMACMGETCGAVTGAFMVIGLKFGKTRPDDEEAKEKTYSLVKRFAEDFKARNSSLVCRELLGCEIGTEEGKRLFDERKYKDTRCSKFVEDAATILEEIL